MRCKSCGAEAYIDEEEAEGWIRHELSVVEKVGISNELAKKDETWICSLECELTYLNSLLEGAGGMKRDLEAIDRLWKPGDA